jgi:hypothetical protein
MLLIDGEWRFATIAIRALAIDGTGAVFAGAGVLNGRPGHTVEARSRTTGGCWAVVASRIRSASSSVTLPAWWCS